VKPNEVELHKIFSKNGVSGKVDGDEVMRLGQKLHLQNGQTVIVTAGGEGAYYFDGGAAELIRGVSVSPPIDTVGAGDTFLSAISACRAADAEWRECIEVGHLASSVIIKKLNTTGTATQGEILKRVVSEQ
jgi:sugar/nucleoside kinase (ribokinase family)